MECSVIIGGEGCKVPALTAEGLQSKVKVIHIAAETEEQALLIKLRALSPQAIYYLIAPNNRLDATERLGELLIERVSRLHTILEYAKGRPHCRLLIPYYSSEPLTSRTFASRVIQDVVRLYQQQHRIDIRQIAWTLVYGEGGGDVTEVISRALRHQPIAVESEGRERLAIVHATDLATILFRYMHSERKALGMMSPGRAYLLTQAQLVSLICYLAKSKSPIEHTSAQNSTLSSTVFSGAQTFPTLAEFLQLPAKPIPLDEGLEDLIRGVSQIDERSALREARG